MPSAEERCLAKALWGVESSTCEDHSVLGVIQAPWPLVTATLQSLPVPKAAAGLAEDAHAQLSILSPTPPPNRCVIHKRSPNELQPNNLCPGEPTCQGSMWGPQL